MQTYRLNFDDLPVSLFGSVMGLTALSIAWRLANQRYGIPLSTANIIGAVAMIAFVVISVCYLVKLLKSRDAVRAEFIIQLPEICSGRYQSACCFCRSYWHPWHPCSHD
jgi:hypothetical protein